MMRTCVLWVLNLILCLSAASIVYAGIQETEWKHVSNGISSADLHSLAVNPANPDMAYAGSFKALYKTIDSGRSWAEVLSFRGTYNGINAIAVDPLNSNVVYAGAAQGLYRSSDQGLHWERIFKGMGEQESTIFAVTVNPNKSGNIYAGTLAGIFYTDDDGKNWRKGRGLPADIIVTSITADIHDSEILYAATTRGIYKSADNAAVWERLYESDFEDDDLHSNILSEVENAEAADVTGVRDQANIRIISIDPANSRTIFAATSKGLLVSNDGGGKWTLTSGIGLVSHNIRDIAVSSVNSVHVYAATDRGIFIYSTNLDTWAELYKGIVSSDIRGLDFSPVAQYDAPALWAVTKMGVYKSSLSLPDSTTQDINSQNGTNHTTDVLYMFSHEPSIEEIKEAAIEYAEVSPNKIRKWRSAAANRAWLPDFSMSYGKSKDWQSSSYFYSTKDEKYEDDDITKGKDRAWSISLTWRLGDLIWNNDQTAIDNRSKLMVQLRDDVLNEVTRLYFERRRLQIDLLMSPPGDNKGMIEKDLRLQELTANIDALTGSLLSRRLAQKGIGAQRQDLTVK